MIEIFSHASLRRILLDFSALSCQEICFETLTKYSNSYVGRYLTLALDSWMNTFTNCVFTSENVDWKSIHSWSYCQTALYMFCSRSKLFFKKEIVDQIQDTMRLVFLISHTCQQKICILHTVLISSCRYTVCISFINVILT